MTSLLCIRSLEVVFKSQGTMFKAVDGVDLDLGEGQSIAVMGESGCGKSVLALAALRLLDHATVRGEVFFDGRDVLAMPLAEVRSLRGRVMGLVPQSPTTAFNPVLRVGVQMKEYGRVTLGLEKGAAEEAALRSLAAIGFTSPGDIFSAYPHELSGGMCERALIAMALCSRPRLLMADEPTKGLDADSKRAVLDSLIEAREGTSLLMITHDWGAAARCQSIAVMYAGEFLEIGPAGRMTNAPLHPYVQGLVAALPCNGMRPIPPSSVPAYREAGCRFRPRCPRADEECLSHPEMRRTAQGLVRCHHA
jgi:oligopeptide/dipeptide ABC transporter ATP-binding protein